MRLIGGGEEGGGGEECGGCQEDGEGQEGGGEDSLYITFHYWISSLLIWVSFKMDHSITPRKIAAKDGW